MPDQLQKLSLKYTDADKQPSNDEESVKEGDEDPKDRPMHPLLQELTPDELETKTIAELLRLVIKRKFLVFVSSFRAPLVVLTSRLNS